MRRATISVPQDLDQALADFMDVQPVRPSLTSVVEAALRFYLNGGPQPNPGRLARVAKCRQQMVTIAHEHGAVGLGLFGSVADGTDGPDSDIDLWVDTGDGVSLFDLAAMRSDLEELLGERVDLLTTGGLTQEAREELVARSFVL